VVIANSFPEIEDSAEGVKQATYHNPDDADKRKRINHRSRNSQCAPTHQHIDNGGEPVKSLYIKKFENCSDCHDAPKRCQDNHAERFIQKEQHERRIASRNQKVNADVVEDAEDALHSCMLNAVVKR